MKVGAILCFFFFCQALAYDKAHVSITDYEFRRYVRPQLKSISNDFQTLFFALNPRLGEYKSAYSIFKEINFQNLQARKECGFEKVSEKCFKILARLEDLLGKSLGSCSKIKAFESAEVKSLMVHQDTYEHFMQHLAHSLIKTQNIIFQLRLIGNFGMDVAGFTDQINFLYDQFNTFLFKNSDPRFKNEFNSFWVNFIRPVENYTLYQNKQDFFKDRLTEYNVRWNMLNVKLTKRNFKPSKQVSTLLNIMHRRWNNILKVSLKPKG